VVSSSYGPTLTRGNRSSASLYRIPTVQTYPFDKRKDFEARHRRFLWFGSRGFVHKRAAWEHARSTHTAEHYAQEYGRMLERILAERSRSPLNASGASK